jgi:hypothetical protein
VTALVGQLLPAGAPLPTAAAAGGGGVVLPAAPPRSTLRQGGTRQTPARPGDARQFRGAILKAPEDQEQGSQASTSGCHSG